MATSTSSCRLVTSWRSTSDMPREYEAIRDRLIRKGYGVKDAKSRAAKIYNSRRKPGQKPVTGKSE